MKNIYHLLFMIILISIQNGYGQDIQSGSPITLPTAPASDYTVASGQKVTITSTTSVTLLPGTHFKSGSEVLVKIGTVTQAERLPIIFANPGFGVNHDYSAWLNDDFDDLVQVPVDNNYNKYIDVKLTLEKRSELTKVSLYDGDGSISHPVEIYAIDGSSTTLIGTFYGNDDDSFVDFPVNPDVQATSIMIRKFGNEIPVKIRAFGRPIPDGTTRKAISATIAQKNDLTCYASKSGKIEVSAKDGCIVYQSIFDGEVNNYGPPIYHYSLDGVHFQKSNTFSGLNAGNYIVFIRDAFNETVQLPVQITEPAPLIISESITPTNCFNTCAGQIAVSVSGGTPPFTYNWSAHPEWGSTSSVSNLCAGVYKVAVSDSKGCTTEKSFNIINGQEINLSQISDKILCSGQSLSLDAGNIGSTYQWTYNNAFSSSSRTVTISQPGNYSLTVTNSNGCSKTVPFTVQSRDYAFKAELIVSSVVNVGDTVILVDITKPTHTAPNWTLPQGVTEVGSNSDGKIKQVVFNTFGTYNLTMQVSDGGCTDIITKEITVYSKEEKNEANTALGYKENPVKAISVYPNPALNNGNFTVAADFIEARNVKVTLTSYANTTVIDTKESFGKSSHEVAFSRADLMPGIYILTVEASAVNGGVADKVVKNLKLIKL